MNLPIFAVCAAQPAVRAALGTDPVRLWPFGQTDEVLAYPYAVYRVVNGAPPQYLGQVPDADAYTLQVDVYAKTAAALAATVTALRDAIEPRAYITRWGDVDKDPETKNPHQSFDVDWIVPR